MPMITLLPPQVGPMVRSPARDGMSGDERHLPMKLREAAVRTDDVGDDRIVPVVLEVNDGCLARLLPRDEEQLVPDRLDRDRDGLRSAMGAVRPDAGVGERSLRFEEQLDTECLEIHEIAVSDGRECFWH